MSVRVRPACKIALTFSSATLPGKQPHVLMDLTLMSAHEKNSQTVIQKNRYKSTHCCTSCSWQDRAISVQYIIAQVAAQTT